MSASGPYAATSTPLSAADEKTASLLTHLGGAAFGWAVPFVAYLLLRNRGPFVRHHTRLALNTQLTLLIPYLFGLATLSIGVGIAVILLTWAVSILLAVLAVRAVNAGIFAPSGLAIPFLAA